MKEIILTRKSIITSLAVSDETNYGTYKYYEEKKFLFKKNRSAGFYHDCFGELSEFKNDKEHLFISGKKIIEKPYILIIFLNNDMNPIKFHFNTFKEAEECLLNITKELKNKEEFINIYNFLI